MMTSRDARNWEVSFVLLLWLCGAGFVLQTLPAIAGPVHQQPEARVKSNTQLALPENLFLGDLNGDDIDDFIQVSGTAGSGNHNRIMVFSTNTDSTGMMHLYLDSDVVRVFTGNFQLSIEQDYGPDQVCVTTESDLLNCYMSKNGGPLTLMWSQKNPIDQAEDIIVGDFDGNGADDLLLYNWSTGTFRMLTRTNTAGTTASTSFGPMAGFSPGSLGSGAYAKQQLRAGQFGSAAGPDGLIAYNPGNGQVALFNLVASGASQTFSAVFTGSKTNPVSPNAEVLSVGRIVNGPTDSLVLRNVSTGGYRFFAPNSSNGNLVGASGVVAGQLPVTAGNEPLFFARLRTTNSASDDTLYFNPDPSHYIVTLVDYDTSKKNYTYQQSTAGTTSTRDQGWPAVQHDLWLVLRCAFPDFPPQGTKPGAANPPGGVEPMFDNDTFIQNWLGKKGVGLGNQVDYLRDVTYGKIDFNIELHPWALMFNSTTALKSYQSQNNNNPAPMRSLGISDCAVNAGFPASQFFGASVGPGSWYSESAADGTIFTNPKYAGIIALWSRSFDSGNNGANMTDFDVGYIHLTGSVHENLHAYGLAHPHTDVVMPWCGGSVEYCDIWDPMGGSQMFTVSEDGKGDKCLMCLSTFGEAKHEPGVNMADFPNDTYTPAAGGPIADPLEINAGHRLYLNSIPAPRIVTLTPSQSVKGQVTETITLAALEKPEAVGALVIKILACAPSSTNYICGDPNHFYTVEYRQKTGWDAAPGLKPGILIHEVFTNGVTYQPGKPPPTDCCWWSTILKTPPAASTLGVWPSIKSVPLTDTQSNGYPESSVTITVNKINTDESNASITVTY